jgi:hypothetical protein
MANSAITMKPMMEARSATCPRWLRFMPGVSARNNGANPGGSIVTSRVTNALKTVS